MDSEAGSDLVGEDLVADTTQNNFNPLFGETAPHSPISPMAEHQQPQPVDEVAGANGASLFGEEDAAVAATAADTAADVEISVSAARSPVSTATEAKPPSRSSSPLGGKRLWRTAPTAVSSLKADDQTETSTNVLLSAATSTTTDYSFAPRPPSATRTTAASGQSSFGLEGAIKSRLASVATATETSGQGAGVGDSESLSCVSHGGEVETASTINIEDSSSSADCTTEGNGPTSGQGSNDLAENREGASRMVTTPDPSARDSATRAYGEGDQHPDTYGGGVEVKTYSRTRQGSFFFFPSSRRPDAVLLRQRPRCYSCTWTRLFS